MLFQTMAAHCRDYSQGQQPHRPALLPNSTTSSRYLHPIHDTRGTIPTDPEHYFTSSRQRQQSEHQNSARLSTASLNDHPLRPQHSVQVSLLGSPRLNDIPPREPANARDPQRHYRNSTDAGYDEEPEPARKRCKLVDTDGWMEKSLAEAVLRRKSTGEPDPFPCPLLTPPSGHSNISRTVAPLRYSGNPSPRYLSPGEFDRSPDLHSLPLSRRSSLVYSSSTPTHSPVPSQATIASTSLRAGFSPPGSVTGLSGFSELDLSTRANSAALDDGDDTATFNQIHDVPQVVLLPRETANTSKLEQLPTEIFMRIMMYCGYKEQVFLKQCNYSLYHAVDLDAIPWERRTEVILFEERHNPNNFPKKPPKGAEYEESEAMSDEEAGSSKKTTKQQSQIKIKVHPDIYGRWGCYCCYKILPAYYFEGSLLEDREGRKAKNHKSRENSAADSDKKIDMRVEYIQIMEPVAGRGLPDWLKRDNVKADVSNSEAYLRERMERGVNCDDLRTYYKGITRDTHLVAPLRGVNPVFTPATEAIPPIPFDRSRSQPLVRKAHKARNDTIPKARLSALPAASSEAVPQNFGLHRPLYKLPAKKVVRGDMESASYTYEIQVPMNAARDKRPSPLSTSQPVGRICLPQRDSRQDTAESTLQAGDVVPLRRVCIPCGTKFAAYRRDCNRKIVSKTSEDWWVCDCPQVRLADRSTGCPTCKRKVIY